MEQEPIIPSPENLDENPETKEKDKKKKTKFANLFASLMARNREAESTNQENESQKQSLGQRLGNLSFKAENKPGITKEPTLETPPEISESPERVIEQDNRLGTRAQHWLNKLRSRLGVEQRSNETTVAEIQDSVVIDQASPQPGVEDSPKPEWQDDLSTESDVEAADKPDNPVTEVREQSIDQQAVAESTSSQTPEVAAAPPIEVGSTDDILSVDLPAAEVHPSSSGSSSESSSLAFEREAAAENRSDFAGGFVLGALTASLIARRRGKKLRREQEQEIVSLKERHQQETITNQQNLSLAQLELASFERVNKQAQEQSSAKRQPAVNVEQAPNKEVVETKEETLKTAQKIVMAGAVATAVEATRVIVLESAPIEAVNVLKERTTAAPQIEGNFKYTKETVLAEQEIQAEIQREIQSEIQPKAEQEKVVKQPESGVVDQAEVLSRQSPESGSLETSPEYLKQRDDRSVIGGSGGGVVDKDGHKVSQKIKEIIQPTRAQTGQPRKLDRAQTSLIFWPIAIAALAVLIVMAFVLFLS